MAETENDHPLIGHGEQSSGREGQSATINAISFYDSISWYSSVTYKSQNLIFCVNDFVIICPFFRPNKNIFK